MQLFNRTWLSRFRWRAAFVSLLAFTSLASAQEGGRVEIPLAVYQELLGGGSSTTDTPGHAFSNVNVTVRASEGDGRVSAEVTVSARVRTFGEGWTLVPLASNGPISNARVGGNPAELIERAGIVAWPVEGEGTHQLQWTYSVDASRHGSGWVLGLANPGTGGQLDATFSGMSIEPVVMPASGVSVSSAGSDTRLSATLGAGSGVQLSWQADATGGFTLSRARYRAEPVGDAMRFTAELVAEVEGNGRAMIPLFPSNVALESVMVGRTEAPIAVQDDRFVVPIRGRGRHRITASFLVPIQRAEGLPRVEVDVAQTPVSRFELSLPGDREVNVNPQAGVETTRRNGKTLASFNVPMTEHVRIEWSEAVPVETVEVETRAHADIVHVVRPEEGVLGLRAFVKYEISRGTLRRADLDIPEGVQINSVESRNGDVVSDWRVEGDVLTVFLDRELEGSLELDVKYERAWPVATRTTNAFEVPMLRAREVHRQRGMVALLAVRELTLEPGESAHVSRVGDNQLPADVRDDLDREPVLDLAHGVENVLAVPVSGIDDDDIDADINQRLNAVVVVHANRSTDAQPTSRIAARGRVLLGHVDVFDRDQPGELPVIVDEDQLLDLVVVEDLLGLVERRIRRCGDRIVRHQVGDLRRLADLEPEVSTRQDPDDRAVGLEHRQTRDAVGLHQRFRVASSRLGAQRDRIEDHAVGAERLTLSTSGDLTLRPAQVLVDHADAALLGERHRPADDSVTVSIAADTSGISSSTLRVSWVFVETSRGTRSARRGRIRTSS